MQPVTQRTPAGIAGFDDLVQGGFPQGSAILLSGTPGTGKTIFALQFLYHGAKDFGDKGLYITLEEKLDHLKMQAEQFGWDLDDLQHRGLLKLVSISSDDLNKNTVQEIINSARSSQVKRLVIDSITTLAINTPISPTSDYGELRVKHFIYSFVNQLKTLMDTTTLIISQGMADGFSADHVSEYICDGIVQITHESLGGAYSRSLTVKKMRRTKNDEDIHPLEISPQGIVVHRIS